MVEDPFKNKQEKLAIKVEVAKPEDWQTYRDIRIEALTKNPEAFGATLEDAKRKTDAEWQADLSVERKFVVLAKSGSGVEQAKSMAGAFIRQDMDAWQVTAVYTRPESRGQGLSKRVMGRVLAEIQNRKGSKARLNVTERIEQESARKLYTKLGFTEIEKGEEDGESYLVMEKDLPIKQ